MTVEIDRATTEAIYVNTNIEAIYQLLKSHDTWLISKEEQCICITNEDGLDAFLAVSGKQIIIESILFAKSQVNNVVQLNEEILKTHQLFPLTTIAITTLENEEYYMAFGSLSAQSKPESIFIEIETLFDNMAAFLDAYELYLA